MRQTAAMRHARIVAALVALVATVVACGGDGSPGSGACDRVQVETVDRRSLVHVLPGAPEVEYLTDPPTSGPHQPTPPIEGVVDQPIARPVQVGILEEGKTLVQHRGLSPAELTELQSIATADIVVAPNPDLPDDAQIVATAWLAKQTCTTVDLRELRRFATDQGQNAPGGDG